MWKNIRIIFLFSIIFLLSTAFSETKIANILLVTRFDWMLEEYKSHNIFQYFKEARCPVSSCRITRDSTLLPNDSYFDIILFANENDWNLTIPKEGSPNPLLIVATVEGPYSVTMQNVSGLANWTMTVRRDSDIFWPYGTFRDLRTHEFVAPLNDPNTPKWRKPDLDEYSREFFRDNILSKLLKGKNKTICWLVSNCFPNSNRNELARSLRKLIPVDIYGRCGKTACPENETCYSSLEQNYMFYLSFENSICKDYVTEKAFRTLQYYIVPIVYGGSNYSMFFPPHSYIDTSNFRTTEDLADYLLFLMDHPEEYVKYFWWKRYYYVELKNFCNLCKRVQDWLVDKKRIPYKNFESWWEDGTCYEHPIIFS